MEDKGPLIIAACWAFTGLSLLFVAARLFVRLAVYNKLMSDDYWIILSTICAVCSNSLVILSVHWGNGQHWDTLDQEHQQEVMRWMIVAYVPGIETLGFPKLAVVCLLSRLLAPGKLHLRILWALSIGCVISLTVTVMTLLLQCSPPSAAWNFDLPRDCIKPKVIEGLAFWASSWSAFLDFYLAIYPAVVLWRLQMSMKKKIGLTIALGMGVISGCVGIVKTTGIPTFLSEDVSYELCEPLYWTSIEGNLIIIAACIPILGPLLEMFKGRPIWRTDKSSSNRQYEDYSKQSTQKQQDAIELRSKHRKKVDAYGFTIHAKDESEEAIVHPDKRSASASSDRRSGGYSQEESEHHHNHHRQHHRQHQHRHHGGTYHNHGEHQIVKSTAITVTYDQGEEGPTSAATRWAAI
ncbi:hypothetical protein CGMCC3_g15048 [Colletotrichum fructicola]|uniref:Rhodopsin domain-containing protein n=1 Tax=Colletotrichum fructicola (strain Nara gc5) TaxID=1213859 RepID=A0A7J6J952_COLFN|nr:uncharacterized protein CGMCC3_g15048 [Colletotrichum fructicola]KAE9568818.1 hypothetical protein CGMCC3_g15048 [Colletotrichum fructicola]KAF4416561.1 hypothetical protein CFRS1_v003853 [Colletotrichum fructicola]KAF4485088.1 hypothetical protein CGGC5_v007664 [Colletotrichum fructicola Nara gc5]KAF5499615.1 hypothetical protein CGCF413_v006936 [Colletotrichum fructicola]